MTTDVSSLLERVKAATGPDRFWNKVDRSGGPDSCWLWLGSLMSRGYGQFSVGPRGGAKNWRTHRLAYELSVGPIPDGMALDHLCRNRRCCNPRHLEPVTTAENNKRAGAAMLVCARGHAMSPDNVLKGRNGTRECRACRLDRKRRYRHAAKLA